MATHWRSHKSQKPWCFHIVLSMAYEANEDKGRKNFGQNSRKKNAIWIDLR